MPAEPPSATPSARVTTIEAVERSGRWLSTRTAGVGTARVMSWKARGLLLPERDGIVRLVRISRGGLKGPVVRPVTFWSAAKLRSLLKLDGHKSMVEFHKAYRRGQEKLTEGGVDYLRSGAAAKRAGVSREALRNWTQRPVGSFHLRFIDREVAGRLTRYYPVADLDEIKRLVHAEPPVPSDEATLKEAIRITGRGRGCLTDHAWCVANGIAQRKHRGTVGANGGRRRVVYSFRRADLVAFAARPVVEVPPGHMTCTEAGKRLQLTRTSVAGLCRERILLAKWGDVAAGHTVKKGWLPTVASVEWAWSVIQGESSPVRAGWLLRKAARERDRPVPPGGSLVPAFVRPTPIVIMGSVPLEVTMTGGKQAAPAPAPPTKARRGKKIADANERVLAYLETVAGGDPHAVRAEDVAAAIGVSAATVVRQTAWEAFEARRRAERPGRVVRTVPLTDPMLAEIPADDDPAAAELADLIRDQERERAEDERPRKRRRD